MVVDISFFLIITNNNIYTNTMHKYNKPYYVAALFKFMQY